MNIPSFSQRPAGAGSVVGIARLIRQVCILREQGDAEGAARLQETEVGNAIRDYRLKHGPEALPEAELHALYATEEHRVAEAAILSELLVPRLVPLLPAASGPSLTSDSRPVFRSQTSAAGSTPPLAGSPAIPDLLDAMLAAERSDRRPLAAGKP